MPLSEKIRVELFIPDLPDPIYSRLLKELGDELTYTFGGCTVVSTQGKYRSDAGIILPDDVNILFTDTPFDWSRDRLLIEAYAEGIQSVVQSAEWRRSDPCRSLPRLSHLYRELTNAYRLDYLVQR